MFSHESTFPKSNFRARKKSLCYLAFLMHSAGQIRNPCRESSNRSFLLFSSPKTVGPAKRPAPDVFSRGGTTIFVSFAGKSPGVVPARSRIMQQKQRKKQKSSELVLAAPGLYAPLSTSPQSKDYWFSGLKVRTVASEVEQTPAGSTRTTASSSAQKARMPVWLMVKGTPTTV